MTFSTLYHYYLYLSIERKLVEFHEFEETSIRAPLFDDPGPSIGLVIQPNSGRVPQFTDAVRYGHLRIPVEFVEVHSVVRL